MKCSNPRFALRPLVENLESRLQPGSVLTGSGYGWSLLADHLSILKPDAWESQRRVSTASSENSNPTPSNAPVDVHNQSLAIAAASVATARTDAFSQPISMRFNDLAAALTDEGLSNVSLTGHGHSVPLAAVATPTTQQPAPATPFGSVLPSPLGVAAPAQPVEGNTPTPVTFTPAHAAATGYHAVPIKANNLENPTVERLAAQPATDALRAVPLHFDNSSGRIGSGASNQASINFLTYLGSNTGPDSISSLLVRSEGGSNFIYVSGSITDSSGRVDALVAKLTDGGTSVVWAELLIGPAAAGPDTSTGLGFADNTVYVVGSLADPAAALQTDAFAAELNATTGALGNNVSLRNSTAAAVTTDNGGNVDIGGSVGDANMASRRNVLILQLTSNLSNLNYAFSMPLTVGGQPANAAITTGGGVSLLDDGPSGRETGGGLIVDAQGNTYFAGMLTVIGTTDSRALYGRVNVAGTAFDWGFSFDNTDQNGSPSPGPGGRGTAVAFDSRGNVVFTGSMNDNGGTPLNQDLILGRVAQDPAVGGGANILDANQMWVNNRVSPTFARVGDWTGNDVTVLPDGSTVVTGAAFDPAAGSGADPSAVPTKGIDVHVTHFLSDDKTTVQNSDHAPENIFGGSGTDAGIAMTFSPTNPSLIYVVGITNSKDLPTTARVVEPTYGGSNFTGFVGAITIV